MKRQKFIKIGFALLLINVSLLFAVSGGTGCLEQGVGQDNMQEEPDMYSICYTLTEFGWDFGYMEVDCMPDGVYCTPYCCDVNSTGCELNR